MLGSCAPLVNGMLSGVVGVVTTCMLWRVGWFSVYSSGWEYGHAVVKLGRVSSADAFFSVGSVRSSMRLPTDGLAPLLQGCGVMLCAVSCGQSKVAWCVAVCPVKGI